MGAWNYSTREKQAGLSNFDENSPTLVEGTACSQVYPYLRVGLVHASEVSGPDVGLATLGPVLNITENQLLIPQSLFLRMSLPLRLSPSIMPGIVATTD